MQSPAVASAVPQTLTNSSRVVVDVVSLTKPRITAMVMLTTFGGMWLALGMKGHEPSTPVVINTLLGTALIVGGANALNMYLERDSDALMKRTAHRPLPAGRLPAWAALGLGIWCAALALPMLTFGVNSSTGLLAALAFFSYVLVYTPLKSRTTAALPIGAVPGAIPPLLGWTAATGRIEVPGLLLFAILWLWQIPHFLAIASFRKEEYRRAGLKVLPAEKGDRVTRHHIVRYSAALVLTTLALSLYGIGGDVYYVVALVFGGAFFGLSAWGLRRSAGPRWAKRLFFGSLVYLTALFVALAV
jgi:protoheme IX farnesyltransferase